MRASRLELLQAMPVFGALREDTLAFLLDRANVVDVPKDGYFFRENDQGSSMFVLDSGEVVVLKTWGGRVYELAHLGEGDCFGEMALIECCARSASVRAVVPSAAFEIAFDVLAKLYEHDLEQFTIIQMNMSREVCRRLRRADDRLFEARMRTEPVHGDFGRYAT